MKINVRDDAKMVEVWLSRAEKNDLQTQLKLKKLYATYKQQKYMVVVFESGERNLYQSTRDLLAINKQRSAELAVQHAKKPHSAAVER